MTQPSIYKLNEILFSPLFMLPVVPLPSPEQQSYGKSDKNRRRRLEPLRRRKSDTGGSGSCRKASNTRSSDGSKAVSAGSGSTFAKRRSSTPGLTSPDIPRPSTTDSINTSSEGASSKKISGSSDATKGLVADQGHLKVSLGGRGDFRLLSTISCSVTAANI